MKNNFSKSVTAKGLISRAAENASGSALLPMPPAGQTAR
jgi:hypothetical protein